MRSFIESNNSESKWRNHARFIYDDKLINFKQFLLVFTVMCEVCTGAFERHCSKLYNLLVWNIFVSIKKGWYFILNLLNLIRN